ncbi:MAG: hypothetical protein FVQ83_08915 [Chloroflexi bacterium]|nr:hypothetical protein [Chloroflexota bacterium]
MRWLFPGKEVRLDTRCLDCGKPIFVRMKDDEILEIDPPSSVGYMMSPFTRWREGSAAFN